ncbi:NADH-quinone oxidoreductase subunit N [Fodinibius sediminis]|uniref:NADH-quinone oxidoreductase subunit N n=1 Tax=Fodinibius sediminis TaxID=1214077 RepID=A0A521CYH7_9BACT|nr:NADH-quinone oxidoreductase subunit N [Fodinibius sediminis]SMO64507.1 NADH dehydrogenase subunit N [Fodinibius sediminis]
MVEQILHSISQFYPEIIIVLTLCAIIIGDLFAKGNSNSAGLIMLDGLILAGIATLFQIGTNEAVFHEVLAVDPFAVFLKILVILAAVFVVLFSMNSSELKEYQSRTGEFYMLLSGMVLGMLLMVGATNLLLMYLVFEITSISSYVLVGFTKKSRRSSESSMKYIIFGAVSSGIMLYGLSLLIGVTGATDIFAVNAALNAGISQPVIFNLSVAMILVGLGFKIAVVPFHFWAPDIYEGATFSIAAILAVASKIAALGLLVRLFTVSFIDIGTMSESGVWQTIFTDDVPWDIVIGIMAALAMIVGNLTALMQDNIKRMLAYSSIAHAGYILMGVVIFSEQGVSSILVYTFIYLFMNLGAFYTAMLFSDSFHTESIEEYKGLGHRAPMEGIAMTIFLVSLTGLPPTGGFIAKLYIFGAAVSAGWIWLVAIAGITTVISLYYYIRVVRNMFLYNPDEGASRAKFNIRSKVMLGVLLVPTLLLGVYFTPLVEFAKQSIVIFGLK